MREEPAPAQDPRAPSGIARLGSLVGNFAFGRLMREQSLVGNRALGRWPSGAGPEEPIRRALAAPGEELEPQTRAAMQRQLGRTIGSVRVHRDADAARAAQAANAEAFTVGNHVVFGRGAYAPGTSHGRQVLAHELLHVQQATGARALALAPPGGHAEQDAAAGRSGGALAGLARIAEKDLTQLDDAALQSEHHLALNWVTEHPTGADHEAGVKYLMRIQDRMLGRPGVSSSPTPSSAGPLVAAPVSAPTKAADVEQRLEADPATLGAEPDVGTNVATAESQGGFLDPDPDVQRAKQQEIEATVEKRAADEVPQMIVREVRRLDERLKTTHYPGRSYELRWRDYLREEMAKRAIPDVPATATRPSEDDEETPKPGGYDMADDQVVEGAVLVPELELSRRIAELSEGMHDADAAQRQRAEDESRPTRMLALRDELIQHGRAADEWAKLLQRRLPFRDMQVLRRYGLAWNNRWVHRGYNQADILAAVEKYIADVAPDNAGDERIQIARADGSILDTQRKYVDVIHKREEIEAVSQKVEGVAQSGPVATAGRLGGAIAGAPFGKSEEFSEWGAMFGQVGDVAAPFAARRFAVTGDVSTPAPRPPAAIVSPAEREPTPTPDSPSAAGPVPVSKPMPPPAPAAPVVEPPAKPPVAPAGRPQLLLPAESVKAPEVIWQERVVDRRQQAVRTATTALNEASADAAREESAVAAAERVLAEKQAAARRQRDAAEKASAAAAGVKRTSPESKDATAKRIAASKADREVAAAQRTVDRAKRDLATAQRAVTRRTQQAKNARDAFKTSEAHLERLRAGVPTRGAPRGLTQVQPARQFAGMGGSTITDPGYEGRRRDDPPLGMQRAIFPRTDGNYRRMLSGRPPIGIDGEPVNLHHRTRGPMSQLDEYTETEHRTLDLHEAGLDSLVDREAFDEQRARYWITRARVLLEQRAARPQGE